MLKIIEKKKSEYVIRPCPGCGRFKTFFREAIEPYPFGKDNRVKLLHTSHKIDKKAVA